MNKKKPLYIFLGQTVLYFIVLLGLLYFFSYLGQSQGSFIYNEFQFKGEESYDSVITDGTQDELIRINDKFIEMGLRVQYEK